MKQNNYQYNGGMPLTQEVLEWAQDGTLEALAAVCKMGYGGSGDPVILNGCVDVGSGVYSEGWMFDGTEIIYFEGGDSVAAGTTNIKVQELYTTAVYESGATQNLHVDKKYVFDATGTDDIVDLVPFHIRFGEEYSGLDPRTDRRQIINVPVAVGNLAGALTIKKLIAIPAIQVAGAITVQAPNLLASPAVYQNIGTISANIRPATEVPFKCLVEVYPVETGGTEHFTDVNGLIKTNGNIDIQFIKPTGATTSYIVKFNFLAPLSAI